jgi:alpha-galactosidase
MSTSTSRFRLRIAALAVVAATAWAALGAVNAGASVLYPPVPYMGVDTWYAFWRNIDQSVVIRYTNSVVSSGLKAAGYRIVWLDAGWWQGQRNSQGQIVVDHRQWPYGMAWLVSYIHSKGLLAGIYTDAGAVGCQNAGSYSHYQRDVDTFARWGFDAIKVDFCGGDYQHLDPRRAYAAFARAVRNDRPRRRMLLAVCNGAIPNDPKYGNPTWAESAYASYSFAKKIATSWRTGPDLGVPGDVPFKRVLQNIALDARHPRAAGNGHWNDPDYLTPDQGMTGREARAQLTMWAILAAPLMLSANLGKLPTSVLEMYENRAVIRIDQDPLGIQGRQVRGDGGISVWTRPLWGGGEAVAVLNRGARTEPYTVTASMAGMSTAKKLVVENVWRHSRRKTADSVRVRVPEHGAVLLRITRAKTAAPKHGRH